MLRTLDVSCATEQGLGLGFGLQCTLPPPISHHSRQMISKYYCATRNYRCLRAVPEIPILQVRQIHIGRASLVQHLHTTGRGWSRAMLLDPFVSTRVVAGAIKTV